MLEINNLTYEVLKALVFSNSFCTWNEKGETRSLANGYISGLRQSLNLTWRM